MDEHGHQSKRTSNTELADAFGRVVSSFSFGAHRFWGAEAAAARLHLALLEFRMGSKVALDDNPHGKALENLAKIPYDSYDAHAYVTNISHLVYATSLLDTFLTDTTLFLLLLHPKAMGSKRQVSLESVFEATSVQDVLTESAAKKARETAHLPFLARLDYLRDTFGLTLELSGDVLRALEHYPSIRNTAVHDQGVFEIRLRSDGELSVRQKTCARHPTHVSDKDVSSAASAYSSVVGLVAREVFLRVIKVDDHPTLTPFDREPDGTAESTNSDE